MSKNNKIVIILIVLISFIAIILIFSQFKRDKNFYSNELIGYTISYPEGWLVREFPDTKTGAGFKPADKEFDCIIIDSKLKPMNERSLSFDEYVKIAAIAEIQNFEKLLSLEELSAVNLTGYKTSWIYRDFDGQEQESLPITYFDNGEMTIQIILEDKDCEIAYNEMIRSLRK